MCGSSFCRVHFYSPSGAPAPCRGVRSRSHSPKASSSAGKTRKATKMRIATISIRISAGRGKGALGLLFGQERQQKQRDDVHPGDAGEDDGPHPVEDGYAVAGTSTFAAHGGRSFRCAVYTLSTFIIHERARRVKPRARIFDTLSNSRPREGYFRIMPQ